MRIPRREILALLIEGGALSVPSARRAEVEPDPWIKGCYLVRANEGRFLVYTVEHPTASLRNSWEEVE